jgi:hypothetical protein
VSWHDLIGNYNGRIGVFPSNYVEVVKNDPTAITSASAESAAKARAETIEKVAYIRTLLSKVHDSNNQYCLNEPIEESSSHSSSKRSKCSNVSC